MTTQQRKLEPRVENVLVLGEKNAYTVILEFGDVSAQTSSWCYEHRNGGHCEVSIRELTVDQLYELADKIISAANKVRVSK